MHQPSKLPSQSTFPDPAGAEESHALANDWTQSGIRLLAANDPVKLDEALACFEAAIQLRADLPLDSHPWYRWGLTAGWMNLAEVFSRLGRFDEALSAYDHALDHLQKLPLDMEPAFRWRLGLVWMKRALTQQSLGHHATACESLEKSIRVLSHPTMTTVRDLGTLGCAWMNHAAMLMESEPPQPVETQESAQKALACLRPFEKTDAVAAEAAIKARHRYCQATAYLLETPPVDAASADNWIMTATDAVEEALSLAAHWQQQGVHFSDVPLQLFRFGCRIYLAYQPQFLGEFMLDVLRPEGGRSASDAYFEAASEALKHAAEILRERGPTDFGLTRLDALLQVLARLEAAARQIQAWREQPTDLPATAPGD